MATDSNSHRSPQEHDHPAPKPARLSSVIPNDLQALIANGYVRWSGRIEAGSVRPKTKDVASLLALGFLIWTPAGREARNRASEQICKRLGIASEAESSAEEERTLP